MNDLSKQQMILVALLVSFVTSLATGIVTVSLMDQAPDGSTRTVSQVIEKTIQQIAPDASSATAVASAHDISTPARAVSKVEKSLVKFHSAESDDVNGIGLIVSKTGVMLADKSSIAGLPDYVALLNDGTEVPVAVVLSQDNGDIVFLEPIIGKSARRQYDAITMSDVPDLGSIILSLSGTTTNSLAEGLLTGIPAATTSSTTISFMNTSISSSKVMPSSPLFDLDGNVIGIYTSSVPVTSGANFYPILPLQSVIPPFK